MAENDITVQQHAEVISKTAIFQSGIDYLRDSIQGLKYAIFATDDGFPVATTQMDLKEATRKAAMTASLDGLSKTVAHESEFSEAIATQVECSDGFIFSRIVSLRQGLHVALLVAARNGESLATIQWHIKKCASDVIEQFNQA